MAEAKIVYIASPYAGNTAVNTAFARAACRMAVSRGCVPIAPHLLYPQILDDGIPKQRECGIRMGIRLLGICGELWLCGNCISCGMHKEMERARQLGVPVRHIPWRDVAEFMQPYAGKEWYLSVEERGTVHDNNGEPV